MYAIIHAVLIITSTMDSNQEFQIIIFEQLRKYGNESRLGFNDGPPA